MEEINKIVSSQTRLKPRKLQKTANKITKGLYYSGKSFEVVFDWLYKDYEICNPTVRKRMKDTLIM